MHTRIALIIALFAAAGAYGAALPNPDAPTQVVKQPNRVRAACSATFTGTNSEGGGGPGQAPIDMTQFGYSINGHTFIPKAPNGQSFKDTKTASQWGGTHTATFEAGWNPGDNHFNGCSVTVDGLKFVGKVQKGHISSGTVSTTTDTCVVDEIGC